MASIWIALAALALSIVSVSIQISNWWASRHKVTVHARTSTAGVGAGDGARNHTYVTLTVRNTGRAISVEDVNFEVVGGDPIGQGPSWANPPAEVPTLIPFEPLPSVFSTGVQLADGGSRSWVFTLNVPPFDRKPLQGVQFIAKVELSNGKTIASKPFWHSQSPAGGWRTEDFSHD